MAKNKWLLGLGIGLVIMWLSVITTPFANHTIGWFTLAAAVVSFGMIGRYRSTASARARSYGSVLLSVFLFALWFWDFSAAQPAWMGWWHLFFAISYLVLGVSARGDRVRRVPDGALDADAERRRQSIKYRRSA